MNRARKLRNNLMTGLFSIAGWVAIVFIALIFLFTFKETAGVLNAHAMRDFFLADPPVWQPTSDIPKLSLIPIMLGTLKATVVGLLFACPIGVAAALFSS